MIIHRVGRRTWACLALLLGLLTSTCSLHNRPTGHDYAHEAALALLIQILREFPPPNGLACVDLAVAPSANGRKLDYGPALRLMDAQGIKVMDGSECVVNRRVPDPADTTASRIPYGAIVHTESGRMAASYRVRVLEFGERRATLRGGFAYRTTHGFECSYDARFEGGRWVVQMLTSLPCAVS